MNIIFICTGNICRSPMAEGIFKSINKKHFVTSAGISAFQGQAVSFNAVEACKELGVDISSYNATRFTEGMAEENDLLLCMTLSQKMQLLNKLKKIKKIQQKVFTLKEYVYGEKDNIDIADPYGYTLNIYQQCRDEIREALLILNDKLEKNV